MGNCKTIFDWGSPLKNYILLSKTKTSNMTKTPTRVQAQRNIYDTHFVQD